MTEQKKRIIETVKYIRSVTPFKKSPSLALITYKNPFFIKQFEHLKNIKLGANADGSDNGERFDTVELIFARLKSKNFYILNGRFHFHGGYTMRDVAHPVYVLKQLGVKGVIFIDEVGNLNPGFPVGGVAFVYDHINLMGDNPLIGENDETLGPRFPDMSNPYDEKLYRKIENIFIDKKFRFFPSVYLGITGPETETEAECRFYREIGSDVLGYGLVPENLAAVHCGLECAAFGMISRELVADRLKEVSEEEQLRNRTIAEKHFSGVIKEIISSL